MTRLEIATAACRALALGMFAFAVATGAGFVGKVLSAFSLGFFEGVLGQSLGEILAAAAWTICGYYLWVRAAALACSMVDESDEPVTRGDLNESRILSTVCAVLGLIVVVRAGRFFVYLLCEWAVSDQSWTAWWRSFGWKAELYGGLVELAFGLWLLFGSSGLVKLVRWARSAQTSGDGRNSEPETPNPSGAADEGGRMP